ncbi:MAG: hypothetical protein GF307_01535 [candidate division Zixibacteria bacterium]|nr:hypothetical protein [candidate division Zixibacteria bacterium]
MKKTILICSILIAAMAASALAEVTIYQTSGSAGDELRIYANEGKLYWTAGDTTCRIAVIDGNVYCKNGDAVVKYGAANRDFVDCTLYAYGKETAIGRYSSSTETYNAVKAILDYSRK